MPETLKQILQDYLDRGILTPYQLQLLSSADKNSLGKVSRLDCETLKYLFTEDGRAAVDAGIINLQQYLQIPSYDRFTMKCLFSQDGRAAVAAGIINLQQYLQIKSYDRDTMKCLFSQDGRAAVAAGIINLQQYLQIKSYNRDSMQYLFSNNGRQAVISGVMTLQLYLQIPTYNHQEVITALSDPQTRQRIRNGELDIRLITGINAPNANPAAANLNSSQSTHSASVHKSVSQSAEKLFSRYGDQIKGKKLDEMILKLKKWMENLPDTTEKNKAAKRCILAITNPQYCYTDKTSSISTLQLLALTYIAI